MFKRNKIKRMVWSAVNAKIAEAQKFHDDKVKEYRDEYKQSVFEAEQMYRGSIEGILAEVVNSITSKFL